MRTTLIRCGIGLALSLALIMLGSESAQSGGDKGKGKGKNSALDPTGHPKGFNKGDPVRYAIWHDKGGWHLRTSTKKSKHHFVGTIHVDGGTITKAHSHHLEKEGTLQDHWRLDMPARKHLGFDFRTEGEIDGITFHVSKAAKVIRFDLRIDGLAHNEKVLIGHNAHHPTNNPFELPAHPGAGKKK